MSAITNISAIKEVKASDGWWACCNAECTSSLRYDTSTKGDRGGCERH